MRMGDERCETCRFWHGLSHIGTTGGEVGVCRRYPPVLIQMKPSEEALQPLADDLQWCGEWQKKPAEAEPGQ
jgi:hypothetical protein